MIVRCGQVGPLCGCLLSLTAEEVRTGEIRDDG